MAKRKVTDGLRQKENGVWERAEIINGKRRWFSSLDPGEVWKKRNAALGESETEQKEKDSGPLFEVVADAYQTKVDKMKYGTQKSYLPAIKRARDHFQGNRMHEIEPYMIAQFLQSLSGMAHTTVSNQKTVINAIFQLWVDSPEWHGNINTAELTKMPRGLKRGKRPPPTDDQVQIVKDHHMDPDALPAVVFLCTGERRGEACAIQLKDIDFEKNTISINKSVEHKNNKPHITDTKTDAGVRKIPLLSLLRESLGPLRELSSETYILSRTEEPLTASQYTRRWAAFWRKYG
ncbi:MAG TPA: site-specific integrase, partial [Anaerovoracaceae bacterium]|nr:site-specific integrase [Anaerovoracaceae bacterium]